MSILKTIDSPADLKRVLVEQLPVLAEEIREQIVSVTSAVGGHVASNLGVIELTVALHYLLDTPKDKIVWDTSNQVYAVLPERSADLATRTRPHVEAELAHLLHEGVNREMRYSGRPSFEERCLHRRRA